MSEQTLQPVAAGRRIPGRVFWLILWLAVFFAVGVIVGYSEAFSECVHARKNRNEYQTLHQRGSIIGSAIIMGQTRIRLAYVCAGEFADKNNGAITALATLMVGLFTFTLWHTTRGLRRRQGELPGWVEMRRS